RVRRPEKRCAGLADSAQRAEIEVCCGGEAGLRAGREVTRAHAEDGDVVLGGDLPQPARSREKGDHRRRAVRQISDYAISWLLADLAQPPGERSNLIAQ